MDYAEVEDILPQYLPSRIICNYSGEDSRIYESYYKEPRDLYTKELIKGTATRSLQMMFVNKDYWKIIFVVTNLPDGLKLWQKVT